MDTDTRRDQGASRAPGHAEELRRPFITDHELNEAYSRKGTLVVALRAIADLVVDRTLAANMVLTMHELRDIYTHAEEGVPLDPKVPAYAKPRRIAGDS